MIHIINFIKIINIFIYTFIIMKSIATNQLT